MVSWVRMLVVFYCCCCVCNAVFICRLLRKAWREAKEGGDTEEWLHGLFSKSKREESVRGVWLWPRHFDPSGPQFPQVYKKWGTGITLWGSLSISLERDHRLGTWRKKERKRRKNSTGRTQGMALIISTTLTAPTVGFQGFLTWLYLLILEDSWLSTISTWLWGKSLSLSVS